ncbi:hypothetical protein [Amycolatopsis pithecellobii]|uniref:Alpha/beta hydrolase n=1 Tax=Amycolatopsis pithecellobii TaxID=664692 RepID=A0A6N7Z8H1_9PSEU|nr:hypothetical protein [Amycolatopsis pithecellobii]MTD57840.1 hypothetical protein [Amycolatopsis pithecellobii]
MNDAPDPIRAGGPAVVTEGTPGGPIVLVLDPAGEAKHGGLPATWRDHPDSWRVMWCRAPAEGGLNAADEILTDPPDSGKIVHILASGPSTDAVLRLAQAHPGPVRSVLLVDPGAAGFVERGEGTDADERWEHETARQRSELSRHGVDVRIVAHSAGGPRDRIPAPLPLGHPDVVAAVQAAVTPLSEGA